MTVTRSVRARLMLTLGILVSLTLTRCGLPYGRIYAVDLLGAALGALLFVPVLDRLSPGGFALLLSALAALASWAYRRSFGVGGRNTKLTCDFEGEDDAASRGSNDDVDFLALEAIGDEPADLGGRSGLAQ